MGFALRRRSAGLAAGLVLMSLTSLVACGRMGVDNTVADGCGGPGISAGEIRAGLILPGSGPSAGDFRDFRAGVDARFGVANATGGVHGRRLVYDWVDDAGEAGRNRYAAHTLVEQQNVFGILEFSTAATGSAVWLHLRGVPVAGVADEPAWGLYDNMFTYSYLPGKDGGVDTWGRYAKAQGGTRAMVVYLEQSDRSRTLAQVFARSMEAVGIDVTAKVEIVPDYTDLAAVARRFRAERADVLIGSVADGDFARLTEAIQAGGPRLRAAISPTGYQPTPMSGRLFPPGSTVFLDYRPFESAGPVYPPFMEALAKYSPQTEGSNRATALEGWLAADIFLRGLREAGPCPTRAAFIQKLRQVKGYDADGFLLRPVDFTGDFGRTNNCFSFMQLDPSGTQWNPAGPLPLCGEYLGAG